MNKPRHCTNVTLCKRLCCQDDIQGVLTLQIFVQINVNFSFSRAHGLCRSGQCFLSLVSIDLHEYVIYSKKIK